MSTTPKPPSTFPTKALEVTIGNQREILRFELKYDVWFCLSHSRIPTLAFVNSNVPLTQKGVLHHLKMLNLQWRWL